MLVNVKLYRPLDASPGMLRFKIYNTAKVALSDSLPVLERMGARVLDEPRTADGEPARIEFNIDTVAPTLSARIEGAEVTASEKVGGLRRVRLLSARGGEVRFRLTYRGDAP